MSQRVDTGLYFDAEARAMRKRDRELILKVSGFNETAWGARGVHLGSDLSTSEWSAAEITRQAPSTVRS